MVHWAQPSPYLDQSSRFSTAHSYAGMLRPRGQIIRPRLTLSGLGLDLSLAASGLIEIGLVASNIYSAHDIN